MSAGELTRRLRDRAHGEGFLKVGVAAAGRLDRDALALEAWLRGDRHAGMVWMERSPGTRGDPRKLLPGCRSVVALSMNYWPGDPPPRSPQPARVARYAWGRDYHKVLGKRLKGLAAWLEEQSGHATRAFVDTGPVLERGWAERAGLGWIGKNANLITRDAGSWLLLGELLTTAELEPDAGPHEDFCGSCTACLDACPTGAIVEPGIVDSRSCVAYWTIERRGTIPAELRAGIGDWIFGCDICQEVCPWNQRFARPAPAERFLRREDLQHPDPEGILAMDEATFRERYSGSSLMRAKWEGMRRNACVVLGNQRSVDATTALSRALDDADPVIRSTAAWALGQAGDDAACEALERAAATERDDDVRIEIRQAIRNCREDRLPK